jgi:hypothetical protein
MRRPRCYGPDVVVHALASRVPGSTPAAVGVVVPALVWPGQLGGLALTARVAWAVDLWAGIVVLPALAGAPMRQVPG